MQSKDVVALGELSGEALGGFTARIEEMHEGIASRVFDSLGASAAPVKAIHDGVAHSLYGLVGKGLGAAAQASAKAVGARVPEDAASLEQTPRGRIAIGALNGAFGDRLEKSGSTLAAEMSVRRRGAAVEPTVSAVRASFPDATPRLAVFLHGLCESEEAWFLGARTHVPYGVGLRADAGYTPIYIRYNSGRHVSDNGRDLAALLEELTSSWPVDVHEIAFIGHSMGGLVARSASHQGAGMEWVTRVRHVFMLGTPHLGAPLERAANVASAGLALLPETRAMASALNLRSSGVKDLRYGYLLEEDWFGHEPDVFLRRAGREIPFLSGANHYFVSATLSREFNSPAARVIGDLLVLHGSAWGHGGRGKRMTFPIDNYRHIGSAHHFDLLNHPAVYEQIRTWLEGRPALEAGSVPPGSAPIALSPEHELLGEGDPHGR
jgi:pimeloyl-ACP methyl ester carboxylesterase